MIQCYDYGTGYDRWTVVFHPGVGFTTNPGHLMMVGLTGHSEGKIGPHLGKRVLFAELPWELQKVVRNDLQDEG
jgi:hypothetical protein